MDDELTLAIQRFDLLAYVRSHAADREGRDEWMLYCPQCGKHKLSVNIVARKWRCFSCEVYGSEVGASGKPRPLQGAGGVFQLVCWLEGVGPAHAARAIIDADKPPASDGVIPETQFRLENQEAVRHPTGLPEKCVAIQTVMPYLERRGISLDDARLFGLGYVPHEGGWLANRIVFPVWHAGSCLYWQARACWDEHEHRPRWVGRNERGEEDKFRKTLNPAQERGGVTYYGASDVVGNLEQAAQYPRPCIVEGPTSGIRVGPDAIWTFGKTLHPQQVGRLIRAGVTAVDFMWDGPGKNEPLGAWPKMITAAALLAPHMDVRLVFLPHGDPGTYPREQLAWFRAHARPYEASRQTSQLL